MNTALFFITLVNALYICTNHTGKMKGMNSLSTSPVKNPICMERAKDIRSICHECYSMAMNAAYSALAALLEKNTDILTKHIIPVEYWPMVNTLFFRLESFGDVQNKNQALNYIELVKAFPRVHFAAWTKNTGIW